MIVTPAGFESVLEAIEHATPLTFAFRGNELLVREADAALPDAAALKTLDIDPARYQPVGVWQGVYCRAVTLPRETIVPAGYMFKSMRALWSRLDDATLAIAGRAFQLADWARNHRFCGACGEPMSRAAGERAMKCACGHIAYPRISPAMMTLVKRGPEILLARNVSAPPNRYSALAGFVEAGESIEDTVHREVREEVGIEVKDLRYFGSQSWPFPNSLMVAFTAEYAGGEVRPAPGEIADAQWFGPGDPLPELSPRQSISRALIEANLPR